MEKHSVIIFGHSTSFSLEPEFWHELKEMAKDENLTVGSFIERIDSARTGHLSGAIRVYILKALKQKVVNNKDTQSNPI